MPTRIHHIQGLIRAVGFVAAVGILVRRSLRLKQPVTVRADGHCIYIRPTDSDLFVASQIFGWREYDIGIKPRKALNSLAAIWRKQGDIPVIVDAGANVGYSALYLADSFPDALVLAVEPDGATLDALKRNCAGSERIIPVHAALWSHEKGVSLRSAAALGSWARSVEEGGSTPSRRLDLLLADIPRARVLLIKLDIEGAEREVCSSAQESIRIAPCIMIEPHDFMFPGAGCLTPLYSAVAGRKMDTLLRGENIFLLDSTLAEAAT
jgi:FkbM family methyltransferase